MAAPTLTYQVPDPQDPAVLLLALGEAGYEASTHATAGQNFVVVACPAGLDEDRERVRDAIATADTSMFDPDAAPGQAVFEDERE